MRSKGLKSIIQALVMCKKPVFYATLFLVIIAMLFSVMAMSLFKKR
jgi:hypothetical protein